MTEQTKTNYYNQYKGLINHTAFRYFQKTGFEYDELVSEGNYILCKCMKEFNPEINIAFSTYLHSVLNYRLSLFIHSNNKNYAMGMTGFNGGWAVIDEASLHHEINTEIFDSISSVSELAGKILDYVFTCKVEKKPRQQKVISKEKIYQKFLGMGFSQHEILRTFDKISLALKPQNL